MWPQTPPKLCPPSRHALNLAWGEHCTYDYWYIHRGTRYYCSCLVCAVKRSKHVIKKKYYENLPLLSAGYQVRLWLWLLDLHIGVITIMENSDQYVIWTCWYIRCTHDHTCTENHSRISTWHSIFLLPQFLSMQFVIANLWSSGVLLKLYLTGLHSRLMNLGLSLSNVWMIMIIVKIIIILEHI